MNLLRAFIALDIPSGLLNAIREATTQVRAEIGNLVRWVPTENMHLTLKFLGDVPPAKIELLSEAIRAEADRCAPFEIHAGGLGVFPNPKRPRVVVVGIQDPAGLDALARGIESACAQLGYDREAREFHPHLTLGRVRQNLARSDGQKIRRVVEMAAIDVPGNARVDSVQLYKSELHAGGAVYTRLFSAPLKSTPI